MVKFIINSVSVNDEMQTVYLLEDNYQKVLRSCFRNIIPYTTIITPGDTTIENDFLRANFVSPYVSAQTLYSRDSEMPELTKYYAQGNFEAREIPGMFITAIKTKLYDDNQIDLLEQVQNYIYSVTIHYENDEHKSAGITIFYIQIPDQNPIWIISHVDDLSQTLDQRSYTLIFSKDLEQWMSDMFILKQTSSTQTINQEPADLWTRLAPKLKSTLLAHLLQPIFTATQPELIIKALNKRLPAHAGNLDNRDEKIEELTDFLSQFAPGQLEDYQRRFIEEFDFFKPETYLRNLKDLKASFAESIDGLDAAYQKLLFTHLRLVIKDERISNTDDYPKLCQGSCDEFEENFLKLLKTRICDNYPDPSLDRCLKLYQVYLKTYPEIFELPQPNIDSRLEDLKGELAQQIRSVYAEKIRLFKQSMVQDLTHSENYWQERQKFLAQKKQQLKELTSYHQMLVQQLQLPSYPELIVDNCEQEFKALTEYQDVLQADLEILYQSHPDIGNMKTAIEAQSITTNNYFAAEFYPNHLNLVFQQIEGQLPGRLTEDLKYRLMKRAKDLQVRDQSKSELSNAKMAGFCNLYFQSENKTNYREKISTYLDGEIEEFKRKLVLSPLNSSQIDQLDIAQSKWSHREKTISDKETQLIQLQQRFSRYLGLVNKYLIEEDALECSQILFAKQVQATQAFQTFKNDALHHQNAYRQFIQEQGFEEAMNEQITTWQSRLPQIKNYSNLLQLKTKSKEIFQKMKAENDIVANSPREITQTVTQEFDRFLTQVNEEIEKYKPISFFNKAVKRWQAFPYQEEVLLISAAITTAAICNPLVVGASIALGVAAISLGLIIFTALRILAQMMVAEAARPRVLT